MLLCVAEKAHAAILVSGFDSYTNKRPRLELLKIATTFGVETFELVVMWEISWEDDKMNSIREENDYLKPWSPND
jgi:hypothetical protein